MAFLLATEAWQNSSWLITASAQLRNSLDSFLLSTIPSLFLRGEAEAQRGYVACPKSHSQEVAEAQFGFQREKWSQRLSG